MDPPLFSWPFPFHPAELSHLRGRDTRPTGYRQARWTKIRSELDAVISGKIKVEALVAARPRGDSIATWKVPEVPTEVRVDNRTSRDFTIVEVITGDYPGVLYEIARTLFGQGLDIHRSKIATEANRVVDTFYVRDRARGQKVADEQAVTALGDALRVSLPQGS